MTGGVLSASKKEGEWKGKVVHTVNVRDGVLIHVLLDGEVDGRDGDSFARPPAHTLKGEDCIGIVGEGPVLWW